MLEAAQQEAANFQEGIIQAHTANEMAQMDLKAAVNENEHLACDLQRAQAAVDALEQEHKRFVEHATQLCERKDADLAVCPASCVYDHWLSPPPEPISNAFLSEFLLHN